MGSRISRQGPLLVLPLRREHYSRSWQTGQTGRQGEAGKLLQQIWNGVLLSWSADRADVADTRQDGVKQAS